MNCLNIEYYVLSFMSQVIRKVLSRGKCRELWLWFLSQNKASDHGSHQLESGSMKVKTALLQSIVYINISSSFGEVHREHTACNG